MKHRITVINGPNLSALERREPEIYGGESLAAVTGRLNALAAELGVELRFLQSHIEGEIVQALAEESLWAQALIINPGAYSHESVAIMDGMGAFPGPVVEVHISNVHAREPFRRRLITARAADAVISGAGTVGYSLALELAVTLLRR